MFRDYSDPSNDPVFSEVGKAEMFIWKFMILVRQPASNLLMDAVEKHFIMYELGEGAWKDS